MTPAQSKALEEVAATTPGPTLLQMFAKGSTEPIWQATYPVKPPLTKGEIYTVGFDRYQLTDWETICHPILGATPARFAVVVKLTVEPAPAP